MLALSRRKKCFWLMLQIQPDFRPFLTSGIRLALYPWNTCVRLRLSPASLASLANLARNSSATWQHKKKMHDIWQKGLLILYSVHLYSPPCVEYEQTNSGMDLNVRTHIFKKLFL